MPCLKETGLHLLQPLQPQTWWPQRPWNARPPSATTPLPEAWRHTLVLEALKLHIQTAHPPLAAAGHVERPASKVDKRQRPKARMEMSEHDWRFFESEWADYKSATGITGSNLLNELWSCMTDDLRRLAFD